MVYYLQNAMDLGANRLENNAGRVVLENFVAGRQSVGFAYCLVPRGKRVARSRVKVACILVVVDYRSLRCVHY